MELLPQKSLNFRDPILEMIYPPPLLITPMITVLKTKQLFKGRLIVGNRPRVRYNDQYSNNYYLPLFVRLKNNVSIKMFPVEN